MQPLISDKEQLRRLIVCELKAHDPVHENVLKHTFRVANLCRSFAEKGQLVQATVEKLEMACWLHDFGVKNCADSELINWAGELNPFQRQKLERHPLASAAIAYELLADSDISDWVLHHHCLRGKGIAGYPVDRCYELKAMPVPLQILICSDQFDSAFSGRCSDPKTAQAIAAEIEHLGAIRAISLDVAHNFRLFIERGLHEQFYQS